jgi:hypothetical protein
MPVLLLISACGVAMVAFAFAAGRADDSWGVPLYWLGEIVFFAPLVFGVVSRRRLNETAILGLLIGLGLATFLIRYSYSPIQFTFPDELQHWRSTQQVLTTHHLSTFNPSLPISPDYPGLEIVTSALVQLTGLSIFSAGMIVVAVVHVLFIIGLFVLLKLIFPDARVAAAGTLIYATEPHFQSFDTIFAYQTFALPFLALSLAATAQLIQERGARRRSWWVAAILATATTVVSHHITSYALLAFLLLIALVVGFQRKGWAPLAMAGICAAFIGIWLSTEARGTFAYLEPAAGDLLSGLTATQKAATTAASSAYTEPAFDHYIGYLEAAVLLILVAVGAWKVWRHRTSDHPLLLAMALASALYLGSLAVRLAAADGTELAGRTLTFTMIPVSAVIAFTLISRDTTRSKFSRLMSTPVLVAIFILFALGGIATGWPPPWERLPGPFIVDGFERTVEPQTVDPAWWARQQLPHNARIAGDAGELSILGTYGDLNPVSGLSDLFYSPAVEPSQPQEVADQSVNYLVIDMRMSQQLPAMGQYFSVDEKAGLLTKPIPVQDLTKFDSVPGLSRLYDNGAIVIYDVQGSEYAP